MADRKFDIEVLIKARNDLSKVMQAAVKDVGKLQDKFDTLNDKTKEANKQINTLGKESDKSADKVKGLGSRVNELSTQVNTMKGRMAPLNERLGAFSTSMLTAGKRVEKFNDNTKTLNHSVNQLQRDIGKLSERTVDSVRQMDKAFEAMNKKINSMGVESVKTTKELESEAEALHKVSNEARQAGGHLGRLGAITSLLSRNANRNEASLQRLALSLRGLQFAFAIKYAQALISTLVGLGGELVAVSGTAISAGAAIGGALSGGALQAIGPLTLLIATLGRLSAIGKALNLRQQIQQTGRPQGSQRDEASDIDRMSNATDGLRNSQEGLAEAQRRLNQERADAARRLRDLTYEEERARLAVLGGQLALESAQRRARNAELEGDVTGVSEGQVDLRSARLNLSESKRDERRLGRDASVARRRGVEGDPQVRAARLALADANRAVVRSERQLAAAQRDTGAAAIDATASQDRLKQLLEDLSPSERKLYRSLIELKSVYQKAFRPITDVIVEAFDRSVNKIIPIFSNRSLLNAFDGLAGEIAVSIDRITSAFTSPEKLSDFQFFIEAASRNIGPITDALIAFSNAFINVAKEGSPLFDYLVDKVKDFAEDIERATENTRGVRDFFKDGKKDLEVFFDLLGSIKDVFLAIFDPARDAGRSAVGDLADDFDKLAKKLRDNEEGVRNFFDEADQVFNDLKRVVGALGAEIIRVFDPSSVSAFADFLVQVFVPAIGNAIEVVGVLARVFHTIFSQPVIAEMAQVIFTITLITRAFQILGGAVGSLSIILSKFAFGLTGIAGGGARIRSSFILLAAAFTALNGIADKTAALIGTGGLAGLLFAFSKQADRARNAWRLFNLGFARTGVGAILVGLGLVAGALLSIVDNNKEVKITADEAKDALDAQSDSMRALRDLDLENKDRKLAVANAELRLAEAQQRQKEVTKGDGKKSMDEKRAALDVRGAKLDLERAQRRLNDAGEDGDRIATEAQKKAKEGLDTNRKRKDQIRDELKDIDKQIEKLKEQNGQVVTSVKSGSHIIDNTAKIADLEEKRDKKYAEYQQTNKRYKKSLDNAGDAFVRLGGNATDFGFTLSDVMSYVEDAVNNGLNEFGAKKVKFATKFKGAKVPSNLPMIRDHAPELERASGGIIPGYGLEDTVPLMAAPGEGILNRHQMPVVDAALRLSGMAQGGLDQLWSTVTTPHYMAGGGRVPYLDGAKMGLAKFARLGARFGLKVSSGLRPGDSDSYHGSGDALDIFGPGGEMLAFAKLMARRFGSQLEELIHTPLGFGIKNGKRVPPYAAADHFDHVHVADTQPGLLGGLFDSIGKIDVSSNIGGGMTRLVQAAANKVRRAANKYLNRKSLEGVNFTPGGPRDKSVMAPGALKAVIARAMRFAGVGGGGWRDMLYDRAIQESAGNPNAVNNWDSNAKAGNNSRGLFQTVPGTFAAYRSPKLPNDIYNALANAVAAIKYMVSRYGKGDPSVALRAMNARRGVGYASGGRIGTVTGNAVSGLPVAKKIIEQAIGRIGDIPGVKGTFADIREDIKKITDPENGMKKTVKALRNLFAEDGPLSRLSEQLDALKTSITDTITKRRFKTGKNGVVKERFGDERQQELELQGLRDVRRGIGAQLSVAEDTEDAAKNALKKARAEKDKKAIKVAQASIKAARLKIKELGVEFNTNEADIFAKREELERTRIDKRIDKLDLTDTRANNAQRIRQAQGFTDVDPTAADRLQNRKTEIASLLKKTKNKALRKELQAQLEELDVAIAEAVSQAFEASISEINRIADVSRKTSNRTSGYADLLTDMGAPLSQVGGLRSAAIFQERGAIGGQINGLVAALGQIDPNTPRAQELRDQIADLTLEMERNHEALRDLTTELEQTSFDQSQSKFGFLGGIVSSGVSIINSIGSLVGNVLDTPAIQNILNKNGGFLSAQRADIVDRIKRLTGVDLQGLSGNDLVTRVLSLAENNPFTDPEQKALFESLITAILSNESAIVDNTNQLEEITNPVKTQTWSSTAWEMFRVAIFNGAGGLLPQYAASIPQMATGGMILQNGPYYGHAGEMVVPAAQVQRGTFGGDTHINLTAVEGKVDPYQIADVLAFRKSINRATT